MAKLNRGQNMMNVVFRKDNIEALSKALTIMCDTWLQLAEEKGQGQILTIREVQTKLDTEIQKKWKTIQDVFLNDGYHDYKMGLFTKEEESLHAKLILDLIKHTDEGYTTLKTQIDHLYNREKSLKDEIHGLQRENLKLQEELTQARWKFNQAVTDSSNSVGRVAQLEQIVKEKSDIISQLQRNANVELWEKEKQKILEKAKCSNYKEEELNHQHEKDKFALKEKVKDLEMQLKKMKFANTLAISKSEHSADLEEEKKYSFLLEKDLKKLDEDLYNLQKQVLGLLGGLHSKFSSCFDKFKTSDKMIEMDPLSKDEFARVATVLYEAHEATADGLLAEYIKKIGIYYQAPDSHIRKVIGRKITSNFISKGMLSPLRQKDAQNLRPMKDANGHNGHSSPILTRKPSKAELKGNPILINNVTDSVNMLIVLRHFPFMLKEDIEDLWKQFKHFDRNGDGTLDLTEVMTGISSSFDNKFTAPQIREAMIEVDTDGDGEMDFFEYVKVANLLKNKAGRSAVYRNTEVQEKGRRMSKVCRIM